MKFLETSAKTAHNVADSFVTMTKEIISQNAEKEKVMNKNDDDKKKKVVLSGADKSKDLNNGGG
jgi:hypothetical protein